MRVLAVLFLVGCRSDAPVPEVAGDPLPSWEAGPTRDAITAFVESVVIAGPDYVDPAERIAVFDNDGTLWVEQPTYIQALFMADRIKSLAPSHPEWATEEPLASILKDDPAGVAKGGIEGFVKVMGAAQGGSTVEEYRAAADAWLATARHPRFDKPYTACAYQPMLEMLAYLRANEFQTWIVSGGEAEFMRAFSEDVYGIPPEQVIGTRMHKAYEVRADGPVLVQDGTIEFVDDGPGKPIGIATQIGRRPLIAFGNSNGDREMLEWTATGPGKRLAVLIHHTDDVDEWAYDRDSHIGHLDKALDQAVADGWTVVDMKADWGRVFPFQP